MTESILHWLRSIAVFLIFMSIVPDLLPEKKDQKYLRFYLGIIMILVIQRPLLAMGNLEEKLEQTLDRLNLEEEVDAMQNAEMKVEGFENLYFSRAYEKEMERQIRLYLEESGISGADVEVWLEDGEEKKVRQIRIEVPEKTESLYESEQKQIYEELRAKLSFIKKELSEVYRVDPMHIVVEIRGQAYD